MASGKLKFCKKAMQDNINALNKSLSEFGLNLSEEKSKLMVFSIKHRTDQPNISLNGVAVQYVDAHKYLGVIFDRKLQFKEDIASTKAKAMKSLRVLKMVKNSHYGSDERMLIKLHKCLTQSIITYGTVVHENVCKSSKYQLEIPNNIGTKIAIRAFVTTPTISCLVESGTLTIEYLRHKAIMKTACKVMCNPHHMLHNALLRSCENHRTGRYKTFVYHMRSLLEKAQLDIHTKVNTNHHSLKPVWKSPPLCIDKSLTIHDKHTTNDAIIHFEFNKLLHKYQDYDIYYTDGSKTDSGVGFGIYSANMSYCRQLP
jgi:hypothetical protein